MENARLSISVGGLVSIDKPAVVRSIYVMWRFIIGVLLGGILHGAVCIIKPPFEFGGGRVQTF
jgi:hypothetical protein